MKNPITHWLKRLILLVLIAVQVGNVYGADRVVAGTEITSIEGAVGCEFVKPYDDFLQAGKSFSRTNPAVLEKYLKLSEKNKALVLKFSDKADNSTLSKFLDDCDDDFVKLLDDNPEYLDCFTYHKTEPPWNINRFVTQSEEILLNPNLSDLQKAKLAKWVDHSSTAAKFGKVTQKGIDLNLNIVNALIKRSGKLFDDLAKHLGVEPDMLKQYEIYTEVPLITEGGFMKADIALVKRNAITNQVEDVIVIENKLSNGTNYTVRQKEGWKKLANGESLKIKYAVGGTTVTGEPVSLLKDATFASNKVRPVKISDHGETDIANTLISDVPVNNWKNYTYTPK